MISPTIPAGSFSTEMGLALSVRCISWQKEDILGKFGGIVRVQALLYSNNPLGYCNLKAETLQCTSVCAQGERRW